MAGAQELSPGGTFIDDDATVYEPSIEALVAAGITDGCSADRYCYPDPVTRGQMAAFLAESLDGLEPTQQDFFPDDDESPHEANINLVTANDIVEGFADGTFGPRTQIIRGEMAIMLVRALGLTPIETPARPLPVEPIAAVNGEGQVVLP